MTDARPHRREALASIAALPLVGHLAGLEPVDDVRELTDDPEPRVDDAARDITAKTLAEAQKLSDLSFDEVELAQAARGLRRQPQSIGALRKEKLGNGDAPATVFRPAPREPVPPQGRGVRALPDGIPERPENELDLAFAPVHVLARLLRARKITSMELTKLCLTRLEKHDPALLCVITLTRKRALEQAARADKEISAGRWRGPLHGVPYGLKDLFAVKGYPTTWGAKCFEDQVLDEDCAVYERLRDAGAVLCAKLTLGALAMGDVWYGGKTRNPWNPEQGSSGSSAGPASAVAGGLLPFAIGTETLGSIISPSTRCGVTGLRPTFGRVSRHGAMALCWSLDKAGPMTRCVRDLALVFDVLQGHDPRDRSTVAAPFRFDPRPLAAYRIGFTERAFERTSAPDKAVLDVLKKGGARLVPVTLPDVNAGLLRPILNVEAAAAFDEITRDGRVKQLVRQDGRSWPNSFRRARFYPAVEFLQACRYRQRVVDAWEDMMKDLDVLVAPSFSGGVLLPTNFTGHPTVVLPNGFGGRGNRPQSMSFVGRLFGDGDALEVANHYQEATGWHRKRPDLG